MESVNITSLRKNLYSFLDNAIRFNEPLSVSTKSGKAVIVSEDDYNDLMETLYVSSIPHMREKIIEGLNTPLSECVSESEVVW
jgi:antitoxin YefM